MNIEYKLVKNNMPATSEKAPYLGMAIPVGSLAYDNILKEMINGGTKMSLPTARYFLEAFYDYAAKKIAAETVRINTGTVAIYPMIDGSFDSEDADFDPERNSLYIGATLSQNLRDRVAGIVPDSSGESAGGTVKMDRIYDIGSQTRGVIDGTNPFRISGRNLTVPDAEDESLALYTKDGVTKVCDIEVSETDGGQLITCHLVNSSVEAIPTGTYKVRLASHGLDPTDPLTVCMLTVTLTSQVLPEEPVFTGTDPEDSMTVHNDEDERMTINGLNLPVPTAETPQSEFKLEFFSDTPVFDEPYHFVFNENGSTDPHSIAFDECTSEKLVIKTAGIAHDFQESAMPGGTPVAGTLRLTLGNLVLDQDYTFVKVSS